MALRLENGLWFFDGLTVKINGNPINRELQQLRTCTDDATSTDDTFVT